MSTGAEIIIRLHDVTAREDSSPTCDTAMSFAPAQSLRVEDKPKLPDCATLEKNFFRLDGSFAPFPNNPQGGFWGMWSQSISGQDGLFSVPPVLRIGFSRSHSSVGLTLRFYEREQDYIKHLRVRWLDAMGNIMSSKEFLPTSAAYFLKNKVEGYYGLEITFYETAKPCRYLKLAGIDYGMELLLGGEELSSATILEEADPMGSTVSINTLDMTVYSYSSDFSPLNPAGFFSLFQQNQKLSVNAIIEGERKDMGGFFLRSWEADGKNNVKLQAVDASGILDKVSCYGGIYEGAVAGQVLESLFALTGTGYELDAGLAQKKLNGYLGVCTARQALGQIAFAIGGVVDCSRSEVVKIYPVPQRPSALIEVGRKFSGQKIGLRPDITGIDVTAHRFTRLSERYTAFDEVLEKGKYTILFTEPTHTPAVTGATVTDTGANYISLAVGSAGKVTVTGGRYLHSKQVISDGLSGQAANLAENRLRVENATLVGTGSTSDILARLRGCCSKGLSSEFSIKLGDERVADMVMVRSMRGESIKGIVESIEIDLTGGCIARMRITAERVETMSGSYTGELYAGQSLGVL